MIQASKKLFRSRPEIRSAIVRRSSVVTLPSRMALHARAVLRKALNQAMRWGYVARNVATLVDPPKVAHFAGHTLTPAEANRFLDTVTGNRLEALYRVAVDRPGAWRAPAPRAAVFWGASNPEGAPGRTAPRGEPDPSPRRPTQTIVRVDRRDSDFLQRQGGIY